MSMTPDRLRSGLSAGHWQDWTNLALAIWLFLSPWILQFSPVLLPGNGAAGAADMGAASDASWNAWILGVIIFIVAAAAIARLQLWEEWLNTLLGIWLFIAPWVLGFVPVQLAAWDHWIVGALVAICAVWDLQTLYAPGRRTIHSN
jgi:hypothetical protein